MRFVVNFTDFSARSDWNHALTEKCLFYEPDYVVSSGFMRIVGEEFINAFDGTYINTHPALLPSFPGAHVVRDALAYGVKVTGCTVHVPDAGVDTGPILRQEAVVNQDEDTEDSLHERIKVAEHRLLIAMLTDLAAGHNNRPVHARYWRDYLPEDSVCLSTRPRDSLHTGPTTSIFRYASALGDDGYRTADQKLDEGIQPWGSEKNVCMHFVQQH